MKRILLKRGLRFFVIFFIMIFLISINFGISLFDNVVADTSIIFVGGSGSDNFNSIQDAVNDASDGDEIFIYEGIYRENIIINKSIKIIGENQASTIIDGSGLDDIFEIISDNVIISNITIRNSSINPEYDEITYAGAYIKSDYNSIIDTIFVNCQIGLILLNSTGNVIDSCEFYNNAGGINLFNTSNSILNNCRIKNHYRLWGISFQRADNNVLSNCNVSDNIGFGLAMTQSDNNIIFDNIFFNNDNGILIAITSKEPCKYNVFYSNDLINNIVLNARDYCENESWDNGIKGNYWSDYDDSSEGAWDNDSDGIIDRPLYIIPTSVGNKDSFPLISPANIGEEKPIINNPPIILNEDPNHNLISLSISYSSLSIYINDLELDTFNWTIETSPYIGENSGFNEYNGIKTCNITDLAFNTTYTWFINVTDSRVSGVYTREFFIFTTELLENDGGGVPSFQISYFLLSIFLLYFIIRYRKNNN